MTSTEAGTPARHRAERAPRPTRRWPTVVLALVLVAGAGLVVGRVVRDNRSGDTDPVIALPSAPDVTLTDFVHGTLVKTHNCLSLSDTGTDDYLLIWPVGTTWKASDQTVRMPQDKVEYPVGRGIAANGAVLQAIPATPSSYLPRSVLDDLRSCSRSTGILQVAFISLG